VKIRRALLSVHDKTGIVELARVLAELGIEIVSTGGTAKLLRESGLRAREVAEVTEFPEMLDGRVKTLHPRIHAGILARRDSTEHLAALDAHAIPPIDLVAVTLYPFEATVSRPGVTLGEALEQIDVGGPTMIRAAAKNQAGVAVLTDPGQYAAVADELRRSGGTLSQATRSRLAHEAFRRTAQYDAAIAAFLRGADATEVPKDVPSIPGEFPQTLRLEGERILALRYGENPHQAAAFYRPRGVAAFGLGAMKQLHGPALGYNSLLDISAALELILEFSEPAAVVIKHTNPCGAAVGGTISEAMARAKASDPVSIYGGIVGVNRPVDMAVVRELEGIFLEVLLGPAYTADALTALVQTKKKCRVFEVACEQGAVPARVPEYRSVLGGLLAQSGDHEPVTTDGWKVVSKRSPTPPERAALLFAWRVARHVKSNAIVLAGGEQVTGVGAGQMNRVDAARLAVARAAQAGLTTRGSVCASDAFFPFRDSLDVVAAAGATAVIHPGGSVRDDEVVVAADEHGMAMIVTGMRHFRH